MQQKRVSKKQQLQYILECRNSGLTDYQWRKEHGIHPGTFYNWVSKLKKSGVKDIPDPISRLDHKPINQEVVKLDVVSDNLTQDNLPVKMEQNACLHSTPNLTSIYLFCGKRCDRIKVLMKEPDGFVLLYKRLESNVQGRFRWPRNSSEVKYITWKQFDWLMSGLEIENHVFR